VLALPPNRPFEELEYMLESLAPVRAERQPALR
jgi:hypothetical protein